MAEHGLPILYAAMIWWGGTGLIIILCALPRRVLGWTLGAATVCAGIAAWALVASARDTSPGGAYMAFGAAVALWGWLETTFLTGLVTGPRKAPLPPGITGWPRLRMAIEALLYHELAIAGLAVLTVALTWGEANQTGTLAFLILFAMRLSAKLNIFLGVPNFTDTYMPAHIAYLKSYFRKAERNWLFPISIAAAAAIAALLGWRALGAEAGGGEAAGYTMLFALLALAILEHAFMVLPVHDAALWRWATPAQGPVKEPRS